ncbi:TonB-dependent receptor [Reichenbachiella ulvae]|uniref:TonB-dependent receptor n=1 Tax=Reichenbachiella ulvae TaxID=2980104 RepID=A0ABT3CS78_9BACT|nr:TonB-dependent receptor [Reichenbachiella ulvae]MCV9386467.1 TonB-dependent receptor [Reichenbachiella ulvae]
MNQLSKTKTLLSLILLFMATTAMAQDMTQNIRGIIIDQDSKSPIIGANVVVVGTDPIKGAVTDIDGSFKIEKVAIGRITIKITYIGYEDKLMPNLLLTSAKEMILDVPIKESFESLKEVVVTAKKDKSEVLNEMALVSSRSFSVDETKRFAGSFADPARMVSGFAGVANSPEGNNDIIVRGNSPKGILWRLEGIEIPNPNHFANDGATGGPINALNSNMLGDSDFMSGAFAPEYGNALSGVFDMKLKRGNNEQREYTAGLSTLGIDFAAEGPFKKDYAGSYLVNYRYSSLDLVDKMGIVDFGGVPKYQDLSFNIHLPVNKKHSFSVFGLGGLSAIKTENTMDDDEEIIGKSEFNNSMGTIGITHNYLIDNKSYLRSYLAISGTSLYSTDNLPLNDGTGGFYNNFNADYTRSYYRASVTYGYKFNHRHKIEVGTILNYLGFNMTQNVFNYETDQMENALSDDGMTQRTQSFLTWKYRMTETLTMTSGLHIQDFGLNNSYNIEPRVAAKWDFAPRKSLNFGVGLHSKTESISVYLWKIHQDDGSYYQPNKDLELTKAAHFVLGYDQAIGTHTHLKAELYYQHLYDVLISEEAGSTYSMINVSDQYTRQALTNGGTGRNYGIELTLEQYLNKGFYYLGSASIFNSLYTPEDGIERKSAFASDYIFNLLIGKEMKMGKAEKNRVFFVNGKISLLGGKRYTPIDLEASIAAGEEVKVDKPFSERSDDIFIANIAVGIRRNKGRTTREFKIDVQNATNNKAIVNEYFIQANNSIYKAPQLPMFPTISYLISF